MVTVHQLESSSTTVACEASPFTNAFAPSVGGSTCGDCERYVVWFSTRQVCRAHCLATLSPHKQRLGSVPVSLHSSETGRRVRSA